MVVGFARSSNLPAPLAELSARIGSNPLLVQGGGGNTSLKCDGQLWVKASGTWLAHALEKDIFVRLPLDQVRAALRHEDSEARLALLQSDSGLRPSIETSLHAMLPHALVAHVHSVNTLAWAVRGNAEAELARRLAGLRWAWVPYRRPGYPLTQAVSAVLAQGSVPPDILVLANHGLVIGAENCDAAEALLQEVERRLDLPARRFPAADLPRLQAVNDLGWSIAGIDLVHGLGADAVACEIASSGVLYPDHVVFLGAQAPVVPANRKLSMVVADLFAASGITPVYALVPDAGVLLAPGISPGAEAMLQCLALVAARLPSADGLVYLDVEELAALTDWEAEAYRRSRDRTRSTA